MWGDGGLQVHGICSRTFAYKEVVKALWNCKKSYFWWFGDFTCVDSTGSNLIEKDQGRVSLRLARGKRAEGTVWFSVCEVSLDDWANGGCFHDLFTCDVCGFRFLSSRSYSKEWVWYLGIKSMLYCFREMKCQQNDTSGI